MKNHSIILVMALIAAGGTSAMETATIASGNDTKQLLGGTIYTVSGDVSVSVGAGKNALEVKHASGDGGNKVVIEIKDGGSLTVTGGDANGRDGAGAGILLPSDMTLYITGKGRLTATGGNAASGGNGTSGANSEINYDGTNHQRGGKGGSGGNGGGGGAAGIGGNGGMGASGGSGAPYTAWQYWGHGQNFPTDGTNGNPGSGGSNGASVTLNGPVMFVGAVAASNVQRTSSAVTGRPSLHRARGSIVKVKASPSSDTVHSDASPGA